MSTLVFLLFISGGGHGAPAYVGRFYDKLECEQAVSNIQELSRAKSGMSNIYGICVPVEARKFVAP